MNFFLSALSWIADGANWHGENGILLLLGQHIGYSLLGVAWAALIGVPLGWWIGHTGRGRRFVVPLSGAVRALPTLGLITLLGLALGIGLMAPLIAFVILALPSVLAGAYTGVESADRSAVDGARACGMKPLQVLTQVEIPLGAPMLIGGLRSASLQVISTATLAAYTGAGGLGKLMFLGLKTQNYTMMLASAILVILLALVSEGIFSLLERTATPAGLRTQRKEPS